MIILRKLFSKKKEEDKKDKKKSTSKAAAAIGLGTSGAILVKGDDAINKSLDHFTSKAVEAMDNLPTSENAKEVMKKLKAKAKKQGIKVVEDSGFQNSAYLGTDNAKGIRKIITVAAKKLRNVDRSAAEQAINGLKEGGKGLGLSSKNSGKLGKDAIAMGIGSEDPSVFAHELGHAQHYKGREGSLVGKIAHRLHFPSTSITSLANGKVGNEYNTKVKNIASGVIGADGFRRGKNSVYTDDSGNVKVKKGKILKSAAIGAAVGAPLLVAEGAASRQGLKMLKKAGANEELMKHSKKVLGNAWGTYASIAAKPVMSEAAGHGIGVAYGVARENIKNKEKDDNTKTE